MQWADVLALSGDAADNVPGVAGVGTKTALALLQQFEDLEAVLGGAGEARAPRLHPVAGPASRLQPRAQPRLRGCAAPAGSGGRILASPTCCGRHRAAGSHIILVM